MYISTTGQEFCIFFLLNEHTLMYNCCLICLVFHPGELLQIYVEAGKIRIRQKWNLQHVTAAILTAQYELGINEFSSLEILKRKGWGKVLFALSLPCVNGGWVGRCACVKISPTGEIILGLSPCCVNTLFANIVYWKAG